MPEPARPRENDVLVVEVLKEFGIGASRVGLAREILRLRALLTAPAPAAATPCTGACARHCPTGKEKTDEQARRDEMIAAHERALSALRDMVRNLANALDRRLGDYEPDPPLLIEARKLLAPPAGSAGT